MSFLIREMVKSDIKHVQDVAKHSWHSTYDGIIPRDVQDNFLNLAYSDDMMEKRVKGSYVFVAEMWSVFLTSRKLTMRGSQN